MVIKNDKIYLHCRQLCCYWFEKITYKLVVRVGTKFLSVFVIDILFII